MGSIEVSPRVSALDSSNYLSGVGEAGCALQRRKEALGLSCGFIIDACTLSALLILYVGTSKFKSKAEKTNDLLSNAAAVKSSLDMPSSSLGDYAGSMG